MLSRFIHVEIKEISVQFDVEYRKQLIILLLVRIYSISICTCVCNVQQQLFLFFIII